MVRKKRINSYSRVLFLDFYNRKKEWKKSFFQSRFVFKKLSRLNVKLLVLAELFGDDKERIYVDIGVPRIGHLFQPYRLRNKIYSGKFVWSIR